ncbi:MAG: hypothetical protein GY953_07490 [bacterium]|nr:hypothetical protein [bacterium]
MNGHPQVVEYAQPVLDAILNVIAEARASFPQGGLEVGGVLYGVGDKHLVRVLAARLIICEHAFGPQFLLSETDHELLAGQLANAGDDPDLDGLEPVGWYVARSRSGAELRESDRLTHRRHFPKGWQIVLVFQPETEGGTALGVYVQDGMGRFPEKPSLLLEGLGASSPAPEEPAATEAMEAATPEEAKQEEVDQEEAEVKEIPFRFAAEAQVEEAKQRERKWPKVAAVLGLLAAAAWATTYWIAPPEYRQAAALYATAAMEHWEVVKRYWTQPAEVVATARPFLLRVHAAGDQVLIRWDGNAAALTDTGQATLAVRDGGELKELPLSGAQLASGSLLYRRQSADVRVRLEAVGTGGEPVIETSRFVGRMSAADLAEGAAGAAPVAPSLDALRSDLLRLEAATRVEQRETSSLLATLEALQGIAATQTAGGQSPAPAETAAAAPSAPLTLAQKAPAVTSRPAVTLEQRGAAGSLGGATARRSRTTSPPRGATSGMLIWTGLLDTERTLGIQGNKPSSGSLSGALPGTPVRVRAYPAELTSKGLTVLSSDQQHAGGDVSESPGPRNAWNRVTYRYSGGEAGLQVVETPSAANDWARISLRPVGRPLSVIVVRWERMN